MSEASGSSPTPRRTGVRPGPGGGGQNRSQTATRHRRFAWALGIVGAIVPAIVLVLIIAFAAIYFTAEIPEPEVSQKATIVDTSGRTLADVTSPDGNRTVVPFDEIPETMKQAIVAAEDREFWTNNGFSPRGLSRAAIGQITGNQTAGGGSTITQQYVKNAIVGDEVSYSRKFKELAIAAKMNDRHGWSKEKILEAYLNTIYFGRGAYGVAVAAQKFFNKSITDKRRAERNPLTFEEAALLSAVIRAPSYYDPDTNREVTEARWRYVLDGMVATGAITRAQADNAVFPKTVKARVSDSDETPGPNGLIKRQVLAELNRIGITDKQLRTGGLKISTTIDPQVQNGVVQAACRKNRIYKCPEGELNGEPDDLLASVVSIDPQTGGVRGYYGGDNPGGWDLAQAGLQTGSSFKVFALVAALEQDIPLSKTYSSAPFQASGGLTVENSDGESCGTCNLATAMKMSLNTVYYRLMMDLDGGARAVADAAHRAGVAESFGNIEHTLQEANGEPEGGVVLGQYQSRVIDMASAYATLAASGVYHEPHFVQKVVDAEGQVLYERKTEGKRVFPAKVADNVSAALEPVAAYSNGNSLYDSSLGSRPSAAKTGTVQLGDTGQNKDAWMVGYTPQLSTAVWVGTSDGTALTNYNGASIYGSGLPSSIWKSAMDAALEGKEIKQFPEPESVGGVAGVPYEAPATTYAPSQPRRGPSIPNFDIPDQGGDGNLTLAPGVTIPIPGAPRNGGGGGAGGGNSPGGGDGGGDTGGGDGGDLGGIPGGGGDGGGGVPEPPIG
ncbi:MULTISPECIES: transglycosylase domain-containing protein [unclassified Gordonia (in: high G+C Gram-positive bacteria)]|uniref:transglycosylase domain-containing protein n=1 Tax=unclassified Gordonia (in: high G+C Gram-positive bacteria) TaxID=2657482 RepID=UPI00083A7A9E|nr:MULTISPECIES: transglycosylase domain-containing protein [unclassified Gordonia (in: high G+C Gram-positive bacteria)]OCW84499.1 penicillin-binding protein [Nocardia farcinica]UCZ88177.1 penicillin-binding protein [Gordonia sp. WA4-43]WGJ85518.1 transglycosylase domain-containing protein [Gordonia sp. SMJS1]